MIELELKQFVGPDDKKIVKRIMSYPERKKKFNHGKPLTNNNFTFLDYSQFPNALAEIRAVAEYNDDRENERIYVPKAKDDFMYDRKVDMIANRIVYDIIYYEEDNNGKVWCVYDNGHNKCAARADGDKIIINKHYK